MAVRGVILDVDGTLVDSNEGQIRAWKEALAHFAIDATLDDVKRLVGMGGDQLLPAISGLERESELGEAISALKKQIFREKYLPDVTPWPDVDELLGRLQATGRRLIVASSTDREGVDDLLRLADPHHLVRELVTADDVDSSKPAPDLIRAALIRLRLPPSQVAMLGDTPYDVAACLPLGVRLIAFRCGGWNDDDLRGAAEVWQDPEDLLENWQESLLGEEASDRKAA